jgi:hypothetical protein
MESEENMSTSRINEVFHGILKFLKPDIQQANPYNLYLKELEARADIYRPQDKNGDQLNSLFPSESSDVLEVFLQKLKLVTEDIQLPNRRNGNPLFYCIGREDVSKLALMLMYGSDPERSFVVENKTHIGVPPLLFAIWYKSKADTRLLMLYGATWEKIPKNKLSVKDKERYDKIRSTSSSEFEGMCEYYQQVTREISDLRTLEKQAEKAAEEEPNFRYFRQEESKEQLTYIFDDTAHALYFKLGDCYIQFANKCNVECRYELSKETLPVFYQRLALIEYEKALLAMKKCFEKYSHIFSVTDLQQQQAMLLAFDKKIMQDCQQLLAHKLHHPKIFPVWLHLEEMKKMLEIMRSPASFKEASVSPDEYESNTKPSTLRQRLIPDSPTQRHSDSDEYKPSPATFSCKP